MYKFDVHIKLMNGIEEIYKKYKIYKNNKVQNKSIFIGPTSAVIESLAMELTYTIFVLIQYLRHIQEKFGQIY